MDSVWKTTSSFSILDHLTGGTERHSCKNMIYLSPISYYKPNVFNSYLHDNALTFQIMATVLLLDHPEQIVVQIHAAAGFSDKMEQMHEKNLYL